MPINFLNKDKTKGSRFHVGDTIRIRSLEKIQETLDSLCMKDGCLFVEQMSRYCSLEVKIIKVVHSILNEHSYIMYKVRHPLYILEKLICDGHFEGSIHKCDHCCYLLWHEEWIETL
jgi:hypothetical protein